MMDKALLLQRKMGSKKGRGERKMEGPTDKHT